MARVTAGSVALPSLSHHSPSGWSIQASAVIEATDTSSA